MKGRTTLTVIAALLPALILPAAVAQAQEPPLIVYGQPLDAKTERIGFADLNLASAAAQARLHHRVGSAIERVCDLDLGRDGLQDRGYYRCAQIAWGVAAPQIAEAITTGKTSLGAAIAIVGN